VYRKLTAALVALALLTPACGGGDEGGGGGDAREAEGSLYTVSLPEGWRDSTDDDAADEVPIKFDRLFTSDRVEGFTVNVNVIREPKPDADIEEIVAAGQKQLEGGFGATDLSPPDKRELGGDAAFSYTYTLEQGERTLRGEQVAAVHEDRLFTVTLTAPEQAFEDQEPEFQEILDSWEWK